MPILWNVFTYVCCYSRATYVKVPGLLDLRILAWGSFHLVWQSAITRKISFVTEYTQGAGALHTDRVHNMMVILDHNVNILINGIISGSTTDPLCFSDYANDVFYFIMFFLSSDKSIMWTHFGGMHAY